ncbi:MAG TPA: HAD family phosphatase, partial [Chlamydiales bacterium]|nr:HAD family phosphatase [Chlamydiales bacterium]
MRIFLCLVFIAGALCAAPQAVVFDWGNVLAFENRSTVVDFMCETFHFSEADFEAANAEKRKAVKAGKSDVEFWLQFADKRGVALGDEWPASYQAILKKSVGVDEEMLAIVSELKSQQIPVGLLSNINDKYTKLIRDFGFYEPFDPCLLSCEMGLEKPDPKAYQLLLEKLALPADEIVFIDDKEENVEAAKKLGIDA